MRVLVIGGTGFIGRYVVDALARAGHSVAAFYRGRKPASLSASVDTILGDRGELTASWKAFRDFSPDVVVDMILSNGSQAETMMRTFRGVAKRVVVPSSMDVYRACGILHGSEKGELQPVPLSEESSLRSTLSPYGPELLAMLRGIFGWLGDEYDKIPVEQAVLNDPELPGTVLRLPMVYGPGDPLHRLYPLVKRMDDHRPAIILEEGAAQWRATRGYVENVAAAIALAVTDPRAAGKVYNAGETVAYSELEWARRVAAAVGWNGRILVLPATDTPPHLRMPGNTRQHWVADTQRIRSELGHKEYVPRDSALRRTVEWELKHPPENIDPAQFDYAAEDDAIRRASEREGKTAEPDRTGAPRA